MSTDRDTRADALRIAIEAAAILGPPAVAALARTVRAEWPELIADLERALESEPPPIGPTPPSAETAREFLRSQRVARRRRRFG